MHRTLDRQLKRFISNPDSLDLPEMQKLLQAISDTYTHYDEDRELLEHSMNLSAKELEENNTRLREEIERVKSSTAQNKELERMNKFMIGRELKMIELKEKIEDLEERISQIQNTETALSS